MGDLNWRLGQNYIKGDDHQTTSNVELIIGIIEKYSLMLGNKFIYMLRVVDLIWKKLQTVSAWLCDNFKGNDAVLKNVKIADIRCSPLFRTTKEKDNKHIIVHSDHVSIFIDLGLEITEPKVRQKNDTWKFYDDRLHKLKSANMLLDSLFTCNSN